MTETLNAKELLKDKFWVVENNSHQPVGILSAVDESFMFSNKNGVVVVKNLKQLKNKLNAEIAWLDFDQHTEPPKEAYGYPTSVVPYNTLYDVKQKLPLFTKSSKSKSLYCAGYFLLKFNKGWAKAFCPKLSTVQQYGAQGPFLTKDEIKAQLQKLKAIEKLQ